MKYLVTMRRRDGVQVPPDALAGMLLAQRDWLQEKAADGTFDAVYTFAQGGGGVAIANVDSSEALTELVTSSPLFGTSNIELQPLAEIAALELIAEALRRVAGVPA
jgi:muconolactone delta-isomerase